MHDSIGRDLIQAKSYSSIYDIIGASDLKKSYGNKGSIIRVEGISVLQMQSEGNNKIKSVHYNNSDMINETQYITSEQYHSLNKKSSDKSIIRSTSTFFYDLDSLVKRHSYHCITGKSESKNNVKIKNSDIIKNGFGVKSEAIVQECATHLKPKLTSKTNKENKKKAKKYFPNDLQLSSEIFLRDNAKMPYKHELDDHNQVNDRRQKFWSFAKYKTEFTNPIDEERKLKKEDRGKRTENPCPCQLFSYACPCTNKKSLTELAKNSKSLTLADQNTITPQAFVEEQKYKKRIKTKKTKDVIVYEDGRTSTTDIIEMVSKEVLSNEPCSRNTNDVNVLRQKSEDVAGVKVKHKVPRKVLCPNCNVMVDVMSTTEEDEGFQSKKSPIFRDNELSAPAAYAYHDLKNSVVESRDNCNHDPQCELVPVCQILPTDNICINPINTNKQSPVKNNPRVVRITKGCRHHPPCTVVPSCQRINVLNNNCEYIPPCLHQPRCVNLPLCAPLSKHIYYEDSLSKPDKDLVAEHLGTTECLHLHQNRYITNNQCELIENQANRVQNTCEYISECSTRFALNPTLGCISQIPSPCHPLTSNKHCISEKSCQYDYENRKQNFVNQEKESKGDVIFIRDVGCQFRNKTFSPKDSLVRSQNSSGSFNYISKNSENYCGNYHTLRYEDKFTIPISAEELSISTGTFSSTEIDSQCPTHGRHQNRDSQTSRPTGFIPDVSPFVGFTHIDPAVNFYLSANDNFKKKVENQNICSIAHVNNSKIKQNSLKTPDSYLKIKCKNMLTARRRRKSRACYRISKIKPPQI